MEVRNCRERFIAFSFLVWNSDRKLEAAVVRPGTRHFRRGAATLWEPYRQVGAPGHRPAEESRARPRWNHPQFANREAAPGSPPPVRCPWTEGQGKQGRADCRPARTIRS